MSRPRCNPHPLPAAPPDNRALFDGDEDAGYAPGDEVDVAELFGGSTDGATVERVARGLVSADWRRA